MLGDFKVRESLNALIYLLMQFRRLEVRDVGLIPGSGRSSGGGHSNPLQYSCLENPMDRGAWQAAVHVITQSWTLLKWLSMHACKWSRWQMTVDHCEWETYIKVRNKVGTDLRTFLKSNLFVFNWRIIALQYCVGFCHR